MISVKILSLIIFFLSFFFIVIIDLFYFPFLDETGLYILIDFSISYSIIVLNIFLFIKGIMYYRIQNNKQNYFLFAISASSFVIVFLFIFGNYSMVFYLLSSRFFSYFTFFNLIIIQNTYLQGLGKEKNYKIILSVVLLMVLGVFYSLRKLAWG